MLDASRASHDSCNLSNSSVATLQSESCVNEHVSAMDDIKPGILKEVNDFNAFLSLTLQDLKEKREQMTAQTAPNPSLKRYIKCQNFMIRKHIQRLEKFDREVAKRLSTLSATFQRPSSPVLSETDDVDAPGTAESFRETAVDCGDPDLSPTPTMDCSMSSSSSSSSNDSAKELSVESERQLRQLEGDLAKMKRRCKHIMDVTDRYVGAIPQNDDLKGRSVSPEMTEDHEPDDFKAVRLTLESCADHMKVLLKTYTKRHCRVPPVWEPIVT